MGLLDQPGDLSRTPLAAVLLELLNRRADGVLEVEHGGGTSRLWFRAGQPVGAQVATGFRPLGLLLLQAGKIDVDALSRSLTELATRAPAAGRAAGRDRGGLAPGRGRGALRAADRLRRRHRRARRGALRLRPEPAGAGVDAGLRISPLRTIVDALERPRPASS